MKTLDQIQRRKPLTLSASSIVNIGNPGSGLVISTPGETVPGQNVVEDCDASKNGSNGIGIFSIGNDQP